MRKNTDILTELREKGASMVSTSAAAVSASLSGQSSTSASSSDLESKESTDPKISTKEGVVKLRALGKRMAYALPVTQGQFDPMMLSLASGSYLPEFSSFMSSNQAGVYGLDEEQRKQETLKQGENGLFIDTSGKPLTVSNREYNVTNDGQLIVLHSYTDALMSSEKKPTSISYGSSYFYLAAQPSAALDVAKTLEETPGILKFNTFSIQDQMQHVEVISHKRISHSSFTKAGAIVCAGYISINEGKITKIDLDSGHYKPTRQNLLYAIGLIIKQYKGGAFHPDCCFSFGEGIVGPEQGKPLSGMQAYEEHMTEHLAREALDSFRRKKLEEHKNIGQIASFVSIAKGAFTQDFQTAYIQKMYGDY